MENYKYFTYESYITRYKVNKYDISKLKNKVVVHSNFNGVEIIIDKKSRINYFREDVLEFIMENYKNNKKND